MRKTNYIGAAMLAASMGLSAFTVAADEAPTCYYDEECAGYVVAGDAIGGESVGETSGPAPGPGPGPGPGPSTPDPM